MNSEFKEEKVITDKVFTLPADADGRKKMEERIEEKHGIKDASVIARSILSKEIKAFFIGGGKRYITLFATHHALESITANLAYMLIDTLLEAEEKGRIYGIDCKLLLSKYRFVVVPCVNPDGVELRYHGLGRTPLYDRLMRMSGGNFSTWQANARGVDLNHNYNAGFAEYKRLEAEKGIYGGAPTRFSGESPESEPEVGYLCNFVRFHDDFAMALTLHTQGEEIYYTSGGEVPPKGEQIGARLASLCDYSLSKPEGRAAYGGFTDWFIREFARPSFTVECGKGENPLPLSDFPMMYLRLRKMLFCAPFLI